MYTVFYPTAECIFFSAAQGTFSRTDLGSLSKCKTIKISPYILPDHNAMKLERNKKPQKLCNCIKINTFLNNQWVTKEIKEEIKATPRIKIMPLQHIRT